MKSKLLRCHCGAHVLVLDYDSDDKMLFLQILPAKMTLWERIKYVFKNQSPCLSEAVVAGEPLTEMKIYFEEIKL